MTREQINKLISEDVFPDASREPHLIETHISWVILCDKFVYKIKKPIHYSFLDFSTLEKRKHYCSKEVLLNGRFTTDVYLGIVPIREHRGKLVLNGKAGELIEYAVRMRKLDPSRQMDVLLGKNQVRQTDIKKLAEQVARFHKKTDVVYQKDVMDVQQKFMGLQQEDEYINKQLGAAASQIIHRAIKVSAIYVDRNKELLKSRLEAGYFRDGHGDLHTRNIFLEPAPVLFDCIEFNDDFRQIDILNDVAFLCMDLEAFGRKELSELFIKHYNKLFLAMRTNEEKQLFIYYKCYRANVRAKVNSLRAKDAVNDSLQKTALQEIEKYLKLMDCYVSVLAV